MNTSTKTNTRTRTHLVALFALVLCLVLAAAIGFGVQKTSAALGADATSDGWTTVGGNTVAEYVNGNVVHAGGWGSYGENSVIRSNPKAHDEDYTVEATFTPDAGTPDNALYGLTAWYVNADNYLAWWVQDIGGNAYASQFYGRVGGNWRSFSISNSSTTWLSPEFNNVWYNSWSDYGVSDFWPATLLNQSSIIGHTITLKAVVSNVTHTGTGLNMKKFELYITDGNGTPKKAITYWIKDTATQDNVKAGVHFNNLYGIGISGFLFRSAADDAKVAEAIAAIDAIPATSNAQYVTKVLEAQAAYDALYDNKSQVPAAKVQKLTEAIASLGTEDIAAVEALLTALPDNATLADKAQVAAARAAYNALQSYQRPLVNATLLAKLTAAEAAIATLDALKIVDDAIDAIPASVTVLAKEVVATARIAYNGLSAARKALIAAAKVAKLEAAEATLAAFKTNTTPDGWSLNVPEGDDVNFHFLDGNIANIDGTYGDVSFQFTHNFAVRENPKAKDEDYTVSATFIPGADQAPGTDRTYGIVPWYVDANNYLIFWLSQKEGGGYSMDFFGVVNGQLHFDVTSDSSTAWDNHPTWGGFNDMWWDASAYWPASLYKQANIVLTATVTLRAVVTNVVHTGSGENMKKFALYIADANGVEKLAKTLWVRNTDTQDNVKAAVYDVNFDIAVANFNFYSASDDVAVTAAETAIAAIPVNTAADYVAKVVLAAESYQSLCDNKFRVDGARVETLVAGLVGAVTKVQGVIAALNATSATFAADVAAARTLFDSLPAALQAEINNESALVAAEAEVVSQAAVAAVVAKINALPATVALADKTAVVEARGAYDALTAPQKATVDSAVLAKLTAAEAAIAALEKAEADAAAAAPVLAQIAALPAEAALALSDKDAVAAARTAYDALTADQKALVTNVAALEAAEAKIAALEEEASKPADKGCQKGCGTVGFGFGAGFGGGLTAGLAVVLLAAAVLLLKKRTAKAAH